MIKWIKFNFEKINLVFRIGFFYFLRVVFYKFLIKYRLHPVIWISSYPLYSDVSKFYKLKYNELKKYDLKHFWFFNKPLKINYDFGSLDFLKKIFLINFFNGYEYSNSYKWYEIQDFDKNAGDIKGVWELSRFNWAIKIASDKNLKLNYKKTIINSFVQIWEQQNPFLFGPNWKCGQETSLRLIHYLVSLRVLGLKPENMNNKKLKFIEQHLKRILPTISYAKGQKNNHWISEAVGLIIGGIWLGKTKGSRFKKIGKRELDRAINTLFNKDGSFSQSSFNYLRHSLTLIAIARLELLADKNNDYFFFNKKLKNAIYLFNQFVYKNTDKTHNWGANDGSNPLSISSKNFLDPRAHLGFYRFVFFGQNYNSDNLTVKTLCSAYRDELLKTDKIYWNKKFFNINVKNGFTVFPDGGLVFFRNKFYQVLIRFPKFNFKPSQDDVGHFDIIYKNVNFALDSGTFSYFTNEKKFNFFQGVHSHNTIYRASEPFSMSKLSRFIFGNWNSGFWKISQKNLFTVVYKNIFSDTFHRKFQFNESSIFISDKVLNSDSKNIVSGITIDADFNKIKLKKNKFKIINSNNLCSIQFPGTYKKIKVPVSFCYGKSIEKTRLIFPISKKESTFVIKFGR